MLSFVSYVSKGIKLTEQSAFVNLQNNSSTYKRLGSLRKSVSTYSFFPEK